MTAELFINNLESLKEGERSRLRALAGQPLDKTLPGFDLFTGLWWPLRARSRAAPRRDASWLAAKLYATFPLPRVEDERAWLPSVLGRCEPPLDPHRKSFRSRFDALLQTPLPALEPHLRWALGEIYRAFRQGRATITGIDWVQLLEDLSIWDRGDEHRRKCDVREIWAKQYLEDKKE